MVDWDFPGSDWTAPFTPLPIAILIYSPYIWSSTARAIHLLDRPNPLTVCFIYAFRGWDDVDSPTFFFRPRYDYFLAGLCTSTRDFLMLWLFNFPLQRLYSNRTHSLKVNLYLFLGLDTSDFWLDYFKSGFLCFSYLIDDNGSFTLSWRQHFYLDYVGT